MNMTEAEALAQSGEHRFFKLDDVPKIEKYFQSIASQASVMYEGSWVVNDEKDAYDTGNILHMAFGSKSGPLGDITTTKGRVRTFISRINLQNQEKDKYFHNYFNTVKKDEDEEEDKVEDAVKDQAEEQNNSTQKDTKQRGFTTAIRGKMILFDGRYREKEIDVFFGVNPRNTMGQRLIY